MGWRWAMLVSVLAGPALACPLLDEAVPIPGSVATDAAEDASLTAWYSDATDIYGHGIMGSVPDALTLALAVRDPATGTCGTVTASAGEGHVFEDTAPRLVDVTGDGFAEVVAVRSSLTQGGQLVIYTVRDGRLQVLAETPYIGRRFRWLAPAAWADLDGDGNVEIAFVDRPHLAKTLRIWRYSAEGFREVAQVAGVSNHAIGEEQIHGGLRRCGDGPEIILADARRSRMLALRFDGSNITARDIGAWSNAAARDAVACR